MKNENLFQSIYCAFRGLATAFGSERNFRPYGVIAVIFLGLNIWLDAGAADWMAYAIVTGGVIAAELINTAIERAVDFLTDEIHPKIKEVKDIAAGAVLVHGIVFFVVEAIVLLPKLRLVVLGG